MLQFKDKTVLITGGGTGIGEALAYQYARRGCNVILTGRRVAPLEKVQQKCIELGVKSWCHSVDMENTATIDALVEWIHKKDFKIDFLLLNAGISQRAMHAGCTVRLPILQSSAR